MLLASRLSAWCCGWNISRNSAERTLNGFAVIKSGHTAASRVTLQLEISPRANRSDRDMRTLGSGIPVAAAISESSSWPCFFRYWRTGVACISNLIESALFLVIRISCNGFDAIGELKHLEHLPDKVIEDYEESAE
jgi:hypothetical protein